MSKQPGACRWIHVAAFASLSVAFGLLSSLTATSGAATWVCAQMLAAAGLGAGFSTLLPAVLAGLAPAEEEGEEDVARGTGAFGFLRGVGFILGVVGPGVVFEAGAWEGGFGYVGAGEGGRVEVYERVLRNVWFLGVGVALVGVLLAVGEGKVEVRSGVEMEVGREGDTA